MSSRQLHPAGGGANHQIHTLTRYSARWSDTLHLGDTAHAHIKGFTRTLRGLRASQQLTVNRKHPGLVRRVQPRSVSLPAEDRRQCGDSVAVPHAPANAHIYHNLYSNVYQRVGQNLKMHTKHSYVHLGRKEKTQVIARPASTNTWPELT